MKLVDRLAALAGQLLLAATMLGVVAGPLLAVVRALVPLLAVSTTAFCLICAVRYWTQR